MLGLIKSLMRGHKENSWAEDSHELPTLGGAGGESRGKNGAEIDQTGWKRASFSGDKRERSFNEAVITVILHRRGGG